MIPILLIVALLHPGPAQDDYPEWLPYIAWYFPPHLVAEAIQVAECESRNHPEAVGAVGEIGLFQIYPKYWAYLVAPGESLHDPETNVRVAAIIARYGEERHGDPWHYWTCQPRNNSPKRLRVLRS